MENLKICKICKKEFNPNETTPLGKDYDMCRECARDNLEIVVPEPEKPIKSVECSVIKTKQKLVYVWKNDVVELDKFLEDGWRILTVTPFVGNSGYGVYVLLEKGGL